MLNHGSSINHQRWELERDNEKVETGGTPTSDMTTDELMANFAGFPGGYNVVRATD